MKFILLDQENVQLVLAIYGFILAVLKRQLEVEFQRGNILNRKLENVAPLIFQFRVEYVGKRQIYRV